MQHARAVDFENQDEDRDLETFDDDLERKDMIAIKSLMSDLSLKPFDHQQDDID